ncbi:hypothetical protein M422DRAFT_29937 [Sphaerobolus stellatus SS14]|uniref:GYF domain-containing protein n=1 Tax=Sphaerobolus stellatus (strain SS14) TaxID=990650 RepID=A0A0C9UQ88_SPHS4|nr:hypothetical protein M422DRAFT_29937 [Sphaerobolus stellatus SS14]
MTATSLQFGPEWMRNKQNNNVAGGGIGTGGGTGVGVGVGGVGIATLKAGGVPAQAVNGNGGGGAGASTYSSLLSSEMNHHAMQAGREQQLVAGGAAPNPFRYSKEEMLQVWREGGGRGGLGLEVEMWEGVVKEVGGEPVGIREMTEGEKKLFALPLNSDLRRRQSHSDFLPTERPKLPHSASSNLGQPRYSLLARKRKEEGGPDVVPLSIPRRLSLTSLNSPLGTPLSPSGGALPSPRPRMGSGTFAGLADGTPDSWRKREPALPEERDEGGGDAAGDHNGSFNDSDASRSVSGRSMAPSPPSVRGDDPGLGAGPHEELSAAMSVLSVLEEDKTRVGASVLPTPVKSGVDGLYKNETQQAPRPPGMGEDPANINWSYMDPKGNVQGPFSASVMQKWYEEGYFSPDLLMKRTHIDADWTPVGELSVRADHEKLFYSSFLERGPPPGLVSRQSSQHLMDGMHGYDRFGSPAHGLPGAPQHITDQFGAASPYRHPLASRGLDPYLGTPTSVSGSPFTGILGVHTASPDLAYRNAPFSPGVNGYEAQASPMGHRTANLGFGGGESPMYAPRLAALRTASGGFDNQGYNGFNTAPASPWGTGNGVGMNHEYDNFGTLRGPLTNGMYGNTGYSSQDGFAQEAYSNVNAGFQPLQSVDAFGTVQGMRPLGNEMENGIQSGLNEQPGMVGAFGNNMGQAGQGFGAPQQVQQQQQIPQQQGSAFQSPALQHAQPVAHTPVSSPWDAPQQAQVPQPRPRPFDPPHPSSRNLVSTPITTEPPASQAITQATAWAEPPQVEHVVESPEPLQPAPVPEVKKAWTTPPEASPKPVEAKATSAVSPVTPSPPAPQPTSKKQAKVEAPVPAKASPASPAPAPEASPKASPTAPAPTPAKPAWGGVATPDESTNKPTLREIQEAEAKKAEARRLAEQKEREKERAARATVTQAPEETQTFTASWGLPTSQAGAAKAKEQPVTPVSATAAGATPAPVWTNGIKPVVVKKTMKEIQEEEERKKKAAVKEKEMATVAARRGYAESANKNVPAQPILTGGAWTTVGIGGRSATPVRPTPPAAPAVMTPPAARPINGTATARPAVASPATSAPQVSKLPAAVKQPLSQPDDGSPPPPSPEFMKWLRDTMRDFKPGFNLDEFLQMILSFSLDFPEHILELISESVYVNSSTMHGRNFANEFAQRRKADAAKAKSLGPTAIARMPSLADVVRTQPKPVQAELPFKVVKKKGRK